MTVVTRFAPSPTGRLHIGNVRAALFNWLFARRERGRFFLRLDDTDTERSTESFATAIEDDLQWLGLNWDEFARQSDRIAAYELAAGRLKEMGRLYPCYETPDELDRRRRFQLARGHPPVYDRAALKLTEAERQKLEAEGRRPHWRFLLDRRRVEWVDLIRGDQTVDTASQSDPVIVRADGTYLYTLPSIIDDIEFSVTHVVRGEDHVANTGTQIEIVEALGAQPPRYAHFSLMTDAEGGKLSKRLESLSVESLREEGLEPMAVLSFLARLGTSDPIEPIGNLSVLIAAFGFDKIGRAPARFDLSELEVLNGRLIHNMPFEAVEDRLAAMGIEGNQAFWDAVKPNLEKLTDAAIWWSIVTGPISPEIQPDDHAFIQTAAAALPTGELDDGTWPAWIAKLKSETGRKGRALFQPLRLALTGLEHGPEMKSLLPLIGRERALKRLAGEAA